WAYECKWDGIRLIANVHADAVRLSGRNESDLTTRFPELTDLGSPDTLQSHTSLVLDGELIMLDQDGRPSFAALAPHINRHHGPRGHAAAQQRDLQYVVFDLLGLDGRDLTQEPFVTRREKLVDLHLEHPVIRIAETFDDGAALWAATAAENLEGVVAKRRDSRYEPGVRSRAWIKAAHRTIADLVIVGWRPQRGQSDSVGALLLAEVGPTGLTFVGAVGSGISERISAALLPVLAQISAAEPAVTASDAARSEAGRRAESAGADRSDVWVEPLLIAEVEYLHKTPAGRLRHPVLRRLRPDLTPADLPSATELGPDQ
nr:non-homologous end-joining DNA ligase [Actinomycetes bacterium]